MMLPENIRDDIRSRLWSTADDLGWSTLSDNERARYYEIWSRDPSIGGTLGHFMDPRKVRVYIKDSLIKPYERERSSLGEAKVLRLLNLSAPAAIVERFIKPHGRRFADGKIICWGKTRDWKAILMAVFERSMRTSGATAYGVVLFETGKTTEESERAVVREAARRLTIATLVWTE